MIDPPASAFVTLAEVLLKRRPTKQARQLNVELRRLSQERATAALRVLLYAEDRYTEEVAALELELEHLKSALVALVNERAEVLVSEWAASSPAAPPV